MFSNRKLCWKIFIFSTLYYTIRYGTIRVDSWMDRDLTNYYWLGQGRQTLQKKTNLVIRCDVVVYDDDKWVCDFSFQFFFFNFLPTFFWNQWMVMFYTHWSRNNGNDHYRKTKETQINTHFPFCQNNHLDICIYLSRSTCNLSQI